MGFKSIVISPEIRHESSYLWRHPFSWKFHLQTIINYLSVIDLTIFLSRDIWFPHPESHQTAAPINFI